jgi:hypothetical protein
MSVRSLGLATPGGLMSGRKPLERLVSGDGRIACLLEVL